MNKSKLSSHVKKGDILFTPMNASMGDVLQLSSWGRDWMPEYLWIGLILKHKGRDVGLRALYKLMEILRAGNIAIAEFSKIIKLPTSKQELFYSTVDEVVGKECLKPLAAVIMPEFSAAFFTHYSSINDSNDDALEIIMSVIKECSGFQEELSTDINYIILWCMVLNGKLHLSQSDRLTADALTNYYRCSHDDEIMHSYRPLVRSLSQAVRFQQPSEFSKLFWKRLGQITSCELAALKWRVDLDMDFFKCVEETMEFIASTNEDRKTDTKFSVIMGIVVYIYKIYKEIIEKQLCNEISGRILFRSMVESFINLKYMMLKEAKQSDVYKMYKAYGLGKYKLPMAKIRDGKYSVLDESHIKEELLELFVNEEMDEEFINTSLGFFDRQSIKKKFEECNEDALYEIYYEYDTNFVHGFWGAIRESSMLSCNNPAHMFHSVPDYTAEQSLAGVDEDCKMLMRKLFDQIAGYIELPDFYLLAYGAGSNEKPSDD